MNAPAAVPLRLAVFGGGGQLARALADRAAIDGAEMLAFTRAEADVTDADATARALDRVGRRAVVVNAAADTRVDAAEAEPDAAFAVNAHGAWHVAQACRAARLPLVHLSTDYVFDGAKAAPYVEDDPADPLNVYGASKHAGELAVRRAGGAAVILRTAWLYSPYGRNFATAMLGRAEEGAPLRVVDDQFGSPTSAWDLADAVLAVARRLNADPDAPRGVFHHAGAGAVSWRGFAEALMRAAAARGGPSADVEPVSTAAFGAAARRPAFSALDSSRLATAYGVAAKPWVGGLDAVVAAILAAASARTRAPE